VTRGRFLKTRPQLAHLRESKIYFNNWMTQRRSGCAWPYSLISNSYFRNRLIASKNRPNCGPIRTCKIYYLRNFLMKKYHEKRGKRGLLNNAVVNCNLIKKIII
jgi:hypothetical protein